MMDRSPWGLRQLVLLLNICNTRSIGLRLDSLGSLGKKLVLVHVHPVPLQEETFKFPMFFLSDDVPKIWEFLEVPLLGLDNQLERDEEIYDMVLKHRFFHISRMTKRLWELQERPTENPDEPLVIHEFMAWWFRGFNVKTNTSISKCSTYDDVTTESLDFFGTDKEMFREWHTQCAQWWVTYAQRVFTPGVAPIQGPQQQDPDTEDPDPASTSYFALGSLEQDCSPQVPGVTY